MPDTQGLHDEYEAHLLQRLLEFDVISSQEIAALTSEQIDELVLRLGAETFDFKTLSKDAVEKLRRNLNLAPTKNAKIDIEKRKQEIVEAKAEITNYLKKIQKNFPEVVGFIVHGSRFNKHKVPSDTSDFDVVVLLQDGTPTQRDTDEHSEYLNKLVQFFVENATDTGKEVQVNEFFTAQSLQNTLDNSQNLTELNWVWSPDAVEYVGGGVEVGEEELSADEFVEYVRKKISQEPIAQAKERMVKNAKKHPLSF